MHCPHCGQQQVSSATRFCSRCGFLLSGIAEVMANNGIVPTNQGGFAGQVDSPRRRGIKLGAFIFFLTFVLVPLTAVISITFNIPPFLPAIAVFLFGGGGILRMVYALMFESTQSKTHGAGPQIAFPQSLTETRSEQQLLAAPARVGIYSPPQQGKWMDTNDLVANRPSVTESTTKLLSSDDELKPN